MLKDKRKRAVVLALLAFFCTAAATYVAVEWKRVGGSLIALVKGKDDKGASNRAVAASLAANVAVAKAPAIDFMPQDEPAHQPEVALLNTRRHVASVGGGSDSFKGKSDDDLFKDGDPAAGIPPGKFIVAQNDTPSAPVGGPDTSDGIAGSGLSGVVSGVTGPAPAPTGNGGSGGGGLLQPSTPVASPPAGTPPTPSAPIPSIPEASSLAMMTLGALFLAVAAARRRNQA
jgi:hypothetical protein